MKTSKILFQTINKPLKTLQHNFFKGKCLSGITVGKNDTFVKTNNNVLFKNIANEIFNNENKLAKEFEEALINKDIGLSSSIIKDIKNPASATGIVLKPNSTDAEIIAKLTNPIINGKGIGINFTEFKEPCKIIKKINSYFKYKENNVSRPPAGIGILNINHPDILDFITMKDNESYKDWCFDLSVVIPDDFLNKVDNNEDITLLNGEKLSAKEIYDTLLNSMLKKGEPGIIFSNKKDCITDACGAKELKENENFTISHINLSNFYDKNSNNINEIKLKNTSDLLSKAIKKIDKEGCIGVLGYQELLDKMNFKYGKNNSIEVLGKCLNIIQQEAHKNDIKTAISPTGKVSKMLNVTPSIEPSDYNNITYMEQLKTIAEAAKYIDCNISNTIILKKDDTKTDVDKIIRFAKQNNVKGITVFKDLNY